MAISLGTQKVKTWFLYVRSASFPRLSRNICREICLYIGWQPLLPCIHGQNLQVVNYSTGQSTHALLDTQLGDCWMYCLVDDGLVLGVENATAIELNLHTFHIVTVGSLNIERMWPGMAQCGEFAYAFGGNVVPAISSCEKYSVKSKTWSKIGSMKAPKSCFTPCKVQNEFYLCCFHSEGSPFEAFNPATETFRCLPVGYKSSLNGSVAFLVDTTIYIAAYEDILVKWQLSKGELEPIVKLQLGNRDLGSSNIPPVREGDQVHWVCYSNGSLVTFDIQSASITFKNFFNTE